MSNAEQAPAGSRRARIARRTFIGSAIVGGAGYWLFDAARQARNQAIRSTDK